jgi:hypothetical protein
MKPSTMPSPDLITWSVRARVNERKSEGEGGRGREGEGERDLIN